MSLSSSELNVSIFKRFQQAWFHIDKLKLKSDIGEPSINETLNTDLGGILDFVKIYLVYCTLEKITNSFWN